MEKEEYRGDYLVVYMVISCMIFMGGVFGWTAHLLLHKHDKIEIQEICGHDGR